VMKRSQGSRCMSDGSHLRKAGQSLKVMASDFWDS